MLLELFPIVVAFTLWREQLANRQVNLWSDNHVVFQAINIGAVHCPNLLGLL